MSSNPSNAMSCPVCGVTIRWWNLPDHLRRRHGDQFKLWSTDGIECPCGARFWSCLYIRNHLEGVEDIDAHIAEQAMVERLLVTSRSQPSRKVSP